jgi:hypothetical protein
MEIMGHSEKGVLQEPDTLPFCTSIPRLLVMGKAYSSEP